MVTVTSDGGEDQTEQDHRPGVVKSAFLAVGSFATAIATILVVAGEWGHGDGVTIFAIIAIGVIAVIAQVSAAVYVVRRRR